MAEYPANRNQISSTCVLLKEWELIPLHLLSNISTTNKPVPEIESYLQ